MIMLCLLLAGNLAFSKNASVYDGPHAKIVVVPVAPVLTQLSRTDGPGGNIKFTTPVVVGVTGFTVTRSPGSASITTSTAAGVVTFTDTFAPTTGIAYTYSVSALDGTTPSPAATLTVCGASLKPVINSITGNATAPPLGATLSVSNMLTGTTYRVSRRPVGGSYTSVASGVTNLSTYFDPFTPSPGTNYEYVIYSKMGPSCSESLASDAKQVNFNALAKPVINSVTPVSAFQLNVDWNQTIPTGTANWILERRQGASGYVLAGGPYGPTERFKEDGRNAPRLNPNTEYCYRVKYTTNGGFTSPYSDDKCGTTPQLPLVSNFNASATNCSRVTLTWTEPSAAVLNEENYKIFRSENGGGAVLIATTGNNISSYIDDNLKPNTNYSYQISALFNGVETPRSSPSATTTKPSVLTLLSNSATAASIQWDKCTPFAQGWKIYVSTNDGPFVEKTQAGAQEDKYNFTGLLPQTKYAVYVVNIFGTGIGGATNTVVFTTPKFPGPTNLNAFPAGVSSIKVTWQDNSNGPDHEDGFVLYRSTDNGATYTQINLPPVLTEYIDKDLKTSQKVCYYVKARFANGFSDESNKKCEVTCPSPLTEFTKITAVSPTEIDLEWTQTENFGETTITLESSLDGVTFTKLADLPGKTTSYRDLSVLPGQKKYYKANVKNEGSCSSLYSLIASATSCPLAPTGVVAKTLNSSTVEVVWDLTEGITKYIIERSTDNIDYVKAGEVDGKLAKFEDTKLASSKKYYYRVSAQNESCTSAPSQVKQESTATTCATPPSNLVAVANSAKEIKVTFTDNSPDESGFELEWSKDEKTWAKVGATLPANSTTTTISTGIDAETKYFFRIRALGEICNSDFSNIANVTTNPAAPTGLTAKGVKINQIDLAWTNTSKIANGIEIQRASGADNNFTEIAKAAVATNSYQNTPLTPATSYKYRVRYASPNGFSDWSNVADATTLIISANENTELAKQISLYPVPTDNTLYIKPTGNVLGKVATRIINASGATLISHDFNGLIEGKTEQINVSGLSSGLYFLELSTAKGSATKKFMKR